MLFFLRCSNVFFPYNRFAIVREEVAVTDNDMLLALVAERNNDMLQTTSDIADFVG